MDGEGETLCTYEIYFSVVISTQTVKQGSGLQLFQEDGSWEPRTYRQVLSSMFMIYNLMRKVDLYCLLR